MVDQASSPARCRSTAQERHGRAQITALTMFRGIICSSRSDALSSDDPTSNTHPDIRMMAPPIHLTLAVPHGSGRKLEQWHRPLHLDKGIITGYDIIILM